MKRKIFFEKNIIAWIATFVIANALTASQRRSSFLLIFLFSCTLRADLSTEIKYGQAMQQAQQGNWEAAHNQLNQLVTNNPDRSDILYDSGVAAYRLKNFESAQAYFKRVTESEDVSTDLKERVHFNLGNTYVATKQLQQAIDEYEKVLDINPDNEAAKENLRIVKEMLEQEKQKEKQKEQEQNKKDQQQKNEQKKEQEKQNQKKDQQQDQQKKEQDQKQDQNGDGEQKDNDSQDQNDQNGQKDQQQNKSGKQDQSEQGDDDHPQPNENTKANDNGDQEEQDGNEKNQTEQSGQESKEEKEGKGDKRPQRGLDDKQNKDKGDDKGNNEHESEPSQDMSEKQLDASQGTQDQQKKQGAQQGHAGIDEQQESVADREKNMSPHERWIEGIMKQQEKSDAQANKALIRQAINKGGTRQHGQKNW